MKAVLVTRSTLLVFATLIFTSCVSTGARQMTHVESQTMTPLETMNPIAERYVKLVLALGEHDPIYVDAYYGPAKWSQDAKTQKLSLNAIREESSALIATLKGVRIGNDDEMGVLRQQYLIKQLEALRARTEMLSGKTFSFDEESKALYDSVAPHQNEQHFEKALGELDRLIPGRGDLATRYEHYRQSFVIPKEKLAAVFNSAISEARRRTQLHIELPANENFELEFVTNKSWSGYNWYKGNAHSLIQINTDLPIYIDRAIDLAAHEGYPGHHVYNVLLEQHLVKDSGWIEFTVYPLFSPQSLIAEGTANFGIEVAFPGKERVAFEKDVLFKLAGIDPSKAERYYEIAALTAKLNYAGNEAARLYLNGEIDRDKAVQWLVKYTLASPERAQQRVRFFDEFRSYVINYNLGLDLVRKYIEKQGGVATNPDKRWEEFKKLISSPRLPSEL